jgi:hypothetical protein
VVPQAEEEEEEEDTSVAAISKTFLMPWRNILQNI